MIFHNNHIILIFIVKSTRRQMKEKKSRLITNQTFLKNKLQYRKFDSAKKRNYENLIAIRKIRKIDEWRFFNPLKLTLFLELYKL